MPATTRSRPKPPRVDGRTRKARAQRRDARAELLDAAAEVFAARGFAEASVDEIARRAGYSKGAVYWHFAGKDELFFALLEDRVDGPTREMIELLESAPPEQDMAPEASRRFVELLGGGRELMLLEQDYWSQAVRDPELRERFARRRARLRRALAGALTVRAKHLGVASLGKPPEEIATVILCLGAGLAQHRLVDPDGVPDDLLGDAIALIYRGLVARAEDRAG